jgi:hypothetical protein
MLAGVRDQDHRRLLPPWNGHPHGPTRADLTAEAFGPPLKGTMAAGELPRASGCYAKTTTSAATVSPTSMRAGPRPAVRAAWGAGPTPARPSGPRTASTVRQCGTPACGVDATQHGGGRSARCRRLVVSLQRPATLLFPVGVSTAPPAGDRLGGLLGLLTAGLRGGRWRTPPCRLADSRRTGGQAGGAVGVGMALVLTLAGPAVAKAPAAPRVPRLTGRTAVTASRARPPPCRWTTTTPRAAPSTCR